MTQRGTQGGTQGPIYEPEHEPVRLLLVYTHPDLPSTRVRVLQLAPHLAERGFVVECRAYPGSMGDKRELWRRRDEWDLVLLQDKLLSVSEALFWRALALPLIFDFDDALPYRHKPKRGSHRSRTRERRFRRTLDVATGIAAGNRFLAGLAEAAAKPVHITPSAVPFPVSEHTARPQLDRFRVGWVGSRGNLDSLRTIGPALQELARELPLELVVIADAGLELDGVEVVHRPWSLAGQEAEIARLDVGVMPLEDNEWNRGKCAYKLLQYMAAGVPSVASAVGMNADLIADGENGLLASDVGDWARALRRLHGDSGLRGRLGRAGRETVASGYTYPVVAEGFGAFARGLVQA